MTNFTDINFLLLSGLGFAMVVTNTIVALYYNVIIAWSLYYFFASMTNQLPWTDCDNWWNTELCFTSDELKNRESFMLLYVDLYDECNIARMTNELLPRGN